MNFPTLSKLPAALRGTAVNRVLTEVRQFHAEGKKTVSLMRGQPDLPTPPHIIEAAEKALRDGRTGYPDNRGERHLREAVAEKLARQNLTYDPGAEILVTDGATCGVCTALAALLNPGDEVLLPSPIYDAYLSPIALWGGRAVPVRSNIHEGRFVFDLQALEAARTPRARVLLLNTPWNPVGTVLRRDELENVLTFARRHNMWIISDEIYEALVYDGIRHISPANISSDDKDRIILVNSLSKTYAMTGWRAGYCAGPSQAINAMFLVLQQFSRGPALFVQDAAACALGGEQTCVQKMAAEYQRRRDKVVQQLSGLTGVRPLVPEGGLFVMVDIGGLNVASEEVRRFLLHKMGVVIMDGGAFGPGGEGTLRVSFAAGEPSLDDGLRLLREGLQQLEATGKPIP